MVLRVAAIAENLPRVRSLTLEPVPVSATGAAVVAAKITVGYSPSLQDGGEPRRLRSVENWLGGELGCPAARRAPVAPTP